MWLIAMLVCVVNVWEKLLATMPEIAVVTNAVVATLVLLSPEDCVVPVVPLGRLVLETNFLEPSVKINCDAESPESIILGRVKTAVPEFQLLPAIPPNVVAFI